jgi:hypothetical protein
MNDDAWNHEREDFAPSWLIYLNCMMMHGLTNFKFEGNTLRLDTTVKHTKHMLQKYINTIVNIHQHSPESTPGP